MEQARPQPAEGAESACGPVPAGPENPRFGRFYAIRSAVSRAIARSSDDRDLLESACRSALIGGHLKMAWIGFAGPDGRIRPEVWAGEVDGYLEAVTLSASATDRHSGGPTGRAMLGNRPVAVRDIATDPSMGPWREAALARGYRSSAALPLTRLGQPYGVFSVYSGEAGAFDDDEVQLLAGVAEDISFGLEAHEAAAAHAAAEARFRASVDTLMVGFGIYSAVRDDQGDIVDFRIEELNPAGCRMHGKPAEELIGRGILELVPEHRTTGIFDAFVRLMETGEPVTANSLVYDAVLGERGRTHLVTDLRASRFGDSVVACYLDVTERDQAQQALRRSEDRYRTIVETAREGIWTIDAQGRTTFANPAFAAMIGVPREDLAGRSILEFVPEEYHDQAYEGLARRSSGIAEMRGVTLRRPDGRIVRTEMSAVPLYDDQGGYRGALAMVADVTERARAEQDLRASEERWRALVQHSSDIICVLNPDGTIRYVSPAVTAILGYEPQDLQGTSALDLVAEVDRPAIGAVLADTVAGVDVPGGPFEVRMAHQNGAERWLSLTGTNLLDNEAVAGLVLNARDVTDRRIFEARLEHQALHDPLTDLPNRALLFDRLEQALARTGRSGTHVGVLFLDVDQFKLVNDSRGHPAGDEALTRIAAIISDSVRPTDTVARFGGDEFVILVEGVDTEDEVMVTAERIRSAIEGPLELSSGRLHVTVSIGAVLSDHRSVAELLSSADAAMYRAKELGRNRAALFATEMREKAADRLTLEADLRRAMAEGGQLAVHYQPVVDLAAGTIVGFEALVRWLHPERGLVSPEQFIPIAEDTGLIGPLGDWVMAQATSQLARWTCRYGRPDLHMAVNLSPRQLADPALVTNVAGHIARAGIAPQALILEITETALMDNVETAVEVLGQLKEINTRLAIDDFGTGYSSLGYLKRLPVDMLKIDRAFVSGLEVELRAWAIPAAIVLLAESLGLEVVAEGVEQANQLRQLLRLRCRLAQGFLFSRPLAVAEMEDRFPSLELPVQDPDESPEGVRRAPWAGRAVGA